MNITSDHPASGEDSTTHDDGAGHQSGAVGISEFVTVEVVLGLES